MINSNQGILHEITPLSDRDCFYVVERIKTECNFPLHTHSEFELNYVENGQGLRRIVGDSIEVISEYDLVLVAGEKLAHTWEQHDCTTGNIREITVQFSSKLFASEFFDRTQFENIQRMLIKAQKGLVFPMSVVLKVYNHIDTLASEPEQAFYKVMKFLTILHELSMCNEARVLSSSSFAEAQITTNSRRVKKVQDYIAQNYTRDIRVSTLASLAGMAVASFSRFFKLSTGKSVVDYIIDIRLGHSTRLLANTTYSIAEICYECGFNNLSNFNRIFRKKKGCSPKDFRENYKLTRKIV